jgi:hypothetical protein
MPDPGEISGMFTLRPAIKSLDWIEFIAGKIEGKIVEFCCRSVAA